MVEPLPAPGRLATVPTREGEAARSPLPEPPARLRLWCVIDRAVQRIRWTAAFAALAFTLCGIALHLTLRDRGPWALAVAYYALSRPLLTIMATCGWWILPRTSVRLRRLAGCLVVLLLGSTLWWDVGWRFHAAPTGSLRVAVWNACHLPLGREAAARTIRSCDADLIGIVETGSLGPEQLTLWEQSLPEYTLIPGRGTMLWCSRHPARMTEHLRLSPASSATVIDVDLSGRTCRAALVDIASSLSHRRDPALAKLAESARSWADMPVVILGDFNTPSGAHALEPLRTHCQLTAEVAGTGYAPTWPQPVPLLNLDQIWINRHVNVSRCQAGWTTASDHRPVVATVTIVTGDANFPP